MKIEEGTKLDFSDVLIRPKRSTLSSRSEVILEREFIFPNAKRSWTGVPIVVSNMDTTGTFDMYKSLMNYKMITCLHKFYTDIDYQQLRTEMGNDFNPDYFAVTVGIRNEDLENLRKITQIFTPTFVCIDVANGYSYKFLEFCKMVREMLPNTILIGGNVVTREMVEELIINGGLDVVKCGIGSGCFDSKTKILMANGTYKNISKIQKGEKVINRDGKSVKVINKICKGYRDVVEIKTNNWYDKTICTPDHRYWVRDLSSSSDNSICSSGKAKLLDKLTKTKPNNSKYKWMKIDNISNKQCMLMPRYINWNLKKKFRIDLLKYIVKARYESKTITTKNQTISTINRYLNSGYDLGYIFGTFLGDGCTSVLKSNGSEIGRISWFFGNNETAIAKKLQNCIKNVLNYDVKISVRNNKNVLFVECYNKCFAKLLLSFGKKTNKHLPTKYYCSDKQYIQGLFDGLIDSYGLIENTTNNNKIYSFGNTSTKLIELYYWCCINLGISFYSNKCKETIEGFEGTHNDNIQQPYQVKTHTMNRFTKDYVYSDIRTKNVANKKIKVWDIEVDCPTHSFIANNSIVHNSVCLTRLQTGVGYPQLSAVMECADAAHGVDGFIMSDGGIQHIGDFGKAFGGGADFVMAGSMFSGHDECPGEIIETNEGKYKQFYGMSSDYAMKKYYGEVAKYRTSEGKCVRVKYKGSVHNTILDVLGGIRSTMTYIGSRKLKHIPKCTTFVRVNNQVNRIYG